MRFMLGFQNMAASLVYTNMATVMSRETKN
jgi:hypothetical protein